MSRIQWLQTSGARSSSVLRGLRIPRGRVLVFLDRERALWADCLSKSDRDDPFLNSELFQKCDRELPEDIGRPELLKVWDLLSAFRVAQP